MTSFSGYDLLANSLRSLFPAGARTVVAIDDIGPEGKIGDVVQAMAEAMKSTETPAMAFLAGWPRAGAIDLGGSAAALAKHCAALGPRAKRGPLFKSMELAFEEARQSGWHSSQNPVKSLVLLSSFQEDPPREKLAMSRRQAPFTGWLEGLPFATGIFAGAAHGDDVEWAKEWVSGMGARKVFAIELSVVMDYAQALRESREIANLIAPSQGAKLDGGLDVGR